MPGRALRPAGPESLGPWEPFAAGAMRVTRDRARPTVPPIRHRLTAKVLRARAGCAGSAFHQRLWGWRSRYRGGRGWQSRLRFEVPASPSIAGLSLTEGPGKGVVGRTEPCSGRNHRKHQRIPGCGSGPGRYVGNVDWQQAASLGIVAVAAIWLLGRLMRRRRQPGSGAGLCGCSGGGKGQPGSIVCRARKGERPQVVVRFR
jgi:hypothetical protein